MLGLQVEAIKKTNFLKKRTRKKLNIKLEKKIL